MALGATTRHPHDSLWPALRPVVLLAGVLLVLRLVYQVWVCPYTLIEDEAQYWVWSTRLDWSYYTKGPGVAWTIALSTALFGTAEWAVRLPAAIAASLGMVGLAGLVWDCSRSRKAAFLAGIGYCLAPSYLALALMMTIDGPFLACWTWAAWAGYRGLALGKRWWLVGLGVLLGVGCLYKYTMLLLPPGIILWAWLWRARLLTRGPWVAWTLLGLLALLLSFAPIAIWNQAHGWPTIKHLLGHLGVAGGDVAPRAPGERFNPLWPLAFIGTFLALIGPVALIGLRAAWDAAQRREHANDRWLAQSYLIATSLTILLFYLGVSLITEPEGNWPIAGGVTLIALAAWRTAELLQKSARATPLGVHVWRWSVVLALVVGLGMLRADLARYIPGVGSLVPTGRFSGAYRMGQHAHRLTDELRQRTGQEPFIIANHYGRASQLWYYTPGRPVVYCSSSLMPGGRATPWDYWPEIDLRRAPGLLGRPALVVGLSQWHWEQVFDRVEPIQGQDGQPILDGDHKRTRQGLPSRPAFLAYGFRGFPPGVIPNPPSSMPAE